MIPFGGFDEISSAQKELLANAGACKNDVVNLKHPNSSNHDRLSWFVLSRMMWSENGYVYENHVS